MAQLWVLDTLFAITKHQCALAPGYIHSYVQQTQNQAFRRIPLSIETSLFFYLFSPLSYSIPSFCLTISFSFLEYNFLPILYDLSLLICIWEYWFTYYLYFAYRRCYFSNVYNLRRGFVSKNLSEYSSDYILVA